jgi:hypothetical protein
MIPGWKCKRHKCLEHDIFISYRVKSEKHLAVRLQLELSVQELPNGKHPVVFLDEVCLQDGEDWRTGFLKGLQHSKLALLLVSEEGLERTMSANMAEDNMLLEYEYALEARKANKMKVLPLLVKNKDHTKFSIFSTERFPAAKHNSGSSTTSLTIKETMAELFSLNGVHISYDDCADKITAIMDKLLETFDSGDKEEADETSSRRSIDGRIEEVCGTIDSEDPADCFRLLAESIRHQSWITATIKMKSKLLDELSISVNRSVLLRCIEYMGPKFIRDMTNGKVVVNDFFKFLFAVACVFTIQFSCDDHSSATFFGFGSGKLLHRMWIDKNNVLYGPETTMLTMYKSQGVMYSPEKLDIRMSHRRGQEFYHGENQDEGEPLPQKKRCDCS